MTILELLIHCNNYDDANCPKVIKYRDSIYKRMKNNDYYFYIHQTKCITLLQSLINVSQLQEEFEIIEPAIEGQEYKEIEKLDKSKFYDYRFPDNWEEHLINKIDEVIEELNKLRK